MGVGIDEPEVIHAVIGEVVEVVVLEVLQSAAQFHWVDVFGALEFEIAFGEGSGQFAPEEVVLEFLDGFGVCGFGDVFVAEHVLAAGGVEFGDVAMTFDPAGLEDFVGDSLHGVQVFGAFRILVGLCHVEGEADHLHQAAYFF